MKSMLILASILLMPLAQSAGDRPFAPIGKWTLAGEDGRCTLSRNFSNGGANVTLVFEPLPRTGKLDVNLHSGESGTAFARARGSIDGGKSRDLEAFATAGDSHRIDRLNAERADFAAAAANDTFVLNLPTRRMTFSIPKFANALAALDGCERALSENVGLSAAEVAAIAREAAFPQMLYRVYDGYQRDAAAADLEDEARARYIVASDGAVIECGLTHKAKDERLNRQSCGLLSGPKFTAARDAAGKPVKGIIFERSRWNRR